jgi:hypothetical protein
VVSRRYVRSWWKSSRVRVVLGLLNLTRSDHEAR